MPEAFLSALYHELMAPPDSWNRELIPLPVPIFPQVPMCMGKDIARNKRYFPVFNSLNMLDWDAGTRPS